ncbi:MAG: 50S ribosomal protein L1, partial [Candidatus Gracilibacteria bacterium]|nr:50S ribosomal protein L1 [Candidatus Gracilibacteria bacterium]
CVFSDGANADELKRLGASVVGGEELIDDIASGKVSPNFDVCVATPMMMRQLGKIAKILGPKGLMPNPKTGTVSDDLVSAVKEIAAGKFEFKTDKQGNVHSIFGKLSFGKDKLKENLNKFLDTILEVKPSGAKGRYINTIYVCNCMGPAIRIDINNR